MTVRKSRTKANMKTAFLILFVALLTSCATLKPGYNFGETVITIGDTNTCVEQPVSATIDHDALFNYLDQGVTLGEKNHNVKVYYQTDANDPLNGRIVAEVNLCMGNTGACLIGQFYIQVPKNEFYYKIQNGLTFTAKGVSVFLIYQNGKLTATPKVCTKTKVTARALR